MSDLAQLVSQLTDPTLKTRVEQSITAAGTELTKLLVIRNRLRTLLNQ